MAKILLAEDDPSVRGFVSRALEMDGHEVVVTEDGGLAAEAALEHNGEFDLLLSDIKMPVMDGIALSLSIAAQYPDITILLMTGFADQRERAHGLDALVHDVVPKPFTLADIRAKVAEALEGREVEKETLAKKFGA
ncbi:response regulator [Maritalea porphyrae]|uniref:Response regulator n=1 Tax=Maritalea porphyrae TaxID=880732 RepID=A0ABQ5UPL4_9HYPH|nr:response regulator [Maritalea porphyrae]GLQ16592.1 response regulator [Maritalea porphyrae]